MKLLIADDSALVRNNLRRLLERKQPDLFILESGDIASTKEMVLSEEPDALLLDIRMPDGSGFDILEYIKERGLKLSTIVLTNYATESNRDRSIASGADYFFDKSNEYNRAIEVLNTLAGSGK